MQIKQKLSVNQRISRTGKCTGAKLNYQVSAPGNTDRIDEAFELVRQTAPSYVGSARKQSIELVKVPGNGNYEFEVDYLPPEEKEEKQGNERIWRVEIKNCTTQTFEAKELVRIYNGDPDTVPPDPGTRINWDGKMDGDSKVLGTRVQTPEMREICVATYRKSKINTAFKRTLFSLAGRINSNAFHGWAPGEVLFESAVQSEPYTNTSGRDLVDITYTFAIRPAQNMTCGKVTVTPVSMWNTVWSISRRDVVNNTNVNCGIYESRIYDYGNFSALDI